MKHLALDVGNVLVNQHMEVFIKAISKQMNISKEEANAFLNRIQRKQDLGITSIRDEIVTHFRIKSEYILDDLIDAWHGAVVPNVTSISYLNEMTQRLGLKVVLVSNLGFEHMNHFNSTLKDSYVYKDSIHHFSCEVGARKPTKLYYKLLLDLYPEFAGCTYVDDLRENLTAGWQMGLNSFHFDLSQHKDQLETLSHLEALEAAIIKNQ